MGRFQSGRHPHTLYWQGHLDRAPTHVCIIVSGAPLQHGCQGIVAIATVYGHAGRGIKPLLIFGCLLALAFKPRANTFRIGTMRESPGRAPPPADAPTFHPCKMSVPLRRPNWLRRPSVKKTAHSQLQYDSQRESLEVVVDPKTQSKG